MTVPLTKYNNKIKKPFLSNKKLLQKGKSFQVLPPRKPCRLVGCSSSRGSKLFHSWGKKLNLILDYDFQSVCQGKMNKNQIFSPIFKKIKKLGIP